MCCQHVDRGTCGTWSTRTWSSSACGACFRRRWPGVSSGTCTWCNKPSRGCCRWERSGRCCPTPCKRRRSDYWARASQRWTAVRYSPKSCRQSSSTNKVEGAKVVAGTRVRSVGIHDDVGIVGGPDEKLHEEPAGPAVVAFRLVQACDLVILVHGSHVPETRGKVRVPRGRTFMQNCVKRSRGLTYLV